jgi:hypothetical protein
VSESENSEGMDDNLDKKSSSASSAPDKNDEEKEEKRELVHELESIPHVSGDWPPMLTGAQEME